MPLLLITYSINNAHLPLYYYVSIFTVRYITCCKTQSCAPEDGQKIARNMLS